VTTEGTTDASGRKAANVVGGDLKNDQTLPDKYFLLSRQEVSGVNHTEIGRVLNDTVHTLWPMVLNLTMCC
jgi:hypothetical protein